MTEAFKEKYPIPIKVLPMANTDGECEIPLIKAPNTKKINEVNMYFFFPYLSAHVPKRGIKSPTIEKPKFNVITELAFILKKFARYGAMALIKLNSIEIIM